MMYYEEALVIGRILTTLQRNMLFDLSGWTPETATEYNRDELLWKRLIEPSLSGLGFVRTQRGEDVVTVASLKALPDNGLLRAWHACDGTSRFADHIIREVEDRHLDP
jgi:hypothetical protein